MGGVREGLRARTRCRPPKGIEREHFAAEGVGFEPTVPSRTQRFSRPPDSATLASLRAGRLVRNATTVRKEAPQHRRGGVGLHSEDDLDLMVEARVRAEVVQGPAGACLRVERAENKTLDPSEHGCSRAHGARFECGHKRGVVEAPALEDRRSFSKRKDLGVSCRVPAQLAFVVAAGDHLPFDEHDGSDRYVAVVGGKSGFRQSDGHGFGVGHGGSLDPRVKAREAGVFGSDAAGQRGPVEQMTCYDVQDKQCF